VCVRCVHHPDHLRFEPQQLHEIKISTVANDALAGHAWHWLQLHQHMRVNSVELLGELERYTTGRGNPDGSGAPKAMGDVMESLVGAMYIDSGGSFPVLFRYVLPQIMQDSRLAMMSEDKEADVNQEETEAEAVSRAVKARFWKLFPSVQELGRLWGVDGERLQPIFDRGEGEADETAMVVD
jgi:dsRNA-specific ribonuclease